MAAVAKLTADDGDVHVIGSPQLVRYLTAQGLIDEYRIMLDPLLLGGGKRSFPDYGSVTALRLLDSRVIPPAPSSPPTPPPGNDTRPASTAICTRS